MLSRTALPYNYYVGFQQFNAEDDSEARTVRPLIKAAPPQDGKKLVAVVTEMTITSNAIAGMVLLTDDEGAKDHRIYAGAICSSVGLNVAFWDPRWGRPGGGLSFEMRGMRGPIDPEKGSRSRPSVVLSYTYMYVFETAVQKQV